MALDETADQQLDLHSYSRDTQQQHEHNPVTPTPLTFSQQLFKQHILVSFQQLQQRLARNNYALANIERSVDDGNVST